MKKKNIYFYVSVEDTKRYGLISASIIGRVRHWCDYNENNKVKDRHHQDYWWSGFISARELAEQTGINQRTIETNLTQLLKTGVLIKGIFNKKGFDRTGWYRVNPSTTIEDMIYDKSVDDIHFKSSSIYDNSVDGYTTTKETIPVNLSVNQNDKQTGNPPVNPPVNPSVEDLLIEEEQTELMLQEIEEQLELEEAQLELMLQEIDIEEQLEKLELLYKEDNFNTGDERGDVLKQIHQLKNKLTQQTLK